MKRSLYDKYTKEVYYLAFLHFVAHQNITIEKAERLLKYTKENALAATDALKEVFNNAD